MSFDPFEALLDSMVPGIGRSSTTTDSRFPTALGLQPGALLGRGAQGEVVRAHDPVLGRDVAVKLSLPDASGPALMLLLREARTTAALDHPAVLAVHRVHQEPGLVAVQYQLAPTRTLASRLADASAGTSWPLVDRLRVLTMVSAALARAHAISISHGDLHAGNVAVADDGATYVLDWSGVPAAQAGQFSGTPATAAPEQLRGGPPSPQADVFALGALLWEAIALRPLRPRQQGEPLGSFLARWVSAPIPPLPDRTSLPAGLAALCADALAAEPAARPDAAEVHARLLGCLSADVEEGRRAARAERHLAEARDGLNRFRELGERLVEEDRVVVVQRTKLAGHAPIAQKRPLWEAEDRVEGLKAEQTEVWTAAVEAATLAALLDPDLPIARSVIAELWWERMRDAEANHDRDVAAVARKRVMTWDDGRLARVLTAQSHVTLELATPVADATVRIFRFVPSGRVLVEELLEERPMPLRRHPLPPGSWLLEVTADGYAPTRYPVLLGRLQHHRGEARLLTAAEIGAGWVYVPGGPFRLGGDPRARQPLDPCEPILGDRFVQRTCVTSAQWLRFLDALPPARARAHAPGEAGLFGTFEPYWRLEGDAWRLPEGWDPQWPVMAINVADAEAYAGWLSAEEGRVVRLPTEEEWEKASRGVDGRSYPWGDSFDPTFAHMRASQPGPPRPAPVGVYPVDRSVYGVRDTSGGMREWTQSLFDEGAHVIRGGTWGDDAHDMHCANRAGLMPMIRYSYVSFRLVTESPRGA